MSPSFQFDADGVRDLQVLWEDGERVFCRGWRADGEGGRSAVLAVLLAAEPPPAALDRLAHEYELRDALDAAWAARPLALAQEGGRTTLVLEDPGGEPLEWVIGEPMEMGRFLGLSMAGWNVLASLGLAGLSLMSAFRAGRSNAPRDDANEAYALDAMPSAGDANAA